MDDQYNAAIYSYSSGWFQPTDYVEEVNKSISAYFLLIVTLLHLLVCESNFIFVEYDF